MTARGDLTLIRDITEEFIRDRFCLFGELSAATENALDELAESLYTDLDYPQEDEDDDDPLDLKAFDDDPNFPIFNQWD